MEEVHIEMQSLHVFWRKYTLKFKSFIMETIKHDIVHVSKSVPWCQKYVHIKACLANEYKPRAWRQDQIVFIPAPGKVNPGDQRYQRRNIAAVPLYLQQSAFKPRKSTETAIPHVITHIQGTVEDRKLHLSFPKY